MSSSLLIAGSKAQRIQAEDNEPLQGLCLSIVLISFYHKHFEMETTTLAHATGNHLSCFQWLALYGALWMVICAMRYVNHIVHTVNQIVLGFFNTYEIGNYIAKYFKNTACFAIACCMDH
jgi:hypothetical protein